jgi:motility quorum-sensing regulator/GCU-specific mRNA interferase toxin
LLGLTMAEAIGVVLGLTRRMLLKSMTTHADHRVWQDVYHSACPKGRTATSNSPCAMTAWW